MAVVSPQYIADKYIVSYKKTEIKVLDCTENCFLSESLFLIGSYLE
jgi:hypothetical protein